MVSGEPRYCRDIRIHLYADLTRRRAVSVCAYVCVCVDARWRARARARVCYVRVCTRASVDTLTCARSGCLPLLEAPAV